MSYPARPLPTAVVAMGYEAAVAALQRPHGLFHEPVREALDFPAAATLEAAD